MIRLNEISGGGLKPVAPPLAHLFAAFHVPMNLVLRDGEVVLENAAYPEGGGLRVLGHAEFLAGEVFRLGYAGIDVVSTTPFEITGGSEIPAARSYPRLATGCNQYDDIDNLRHFELAELELAPKVSADGLRSDQLDPLRLDSPPFISGSTRSLKAEINPSVSSAV